MDIEYDLASNLAIHLGLSVLDLGVNAAAATAAAAAGAHFNHDAITTRVLCLGAVAGAMKSGFLNAAVVLRLTATNIFVQAVIIIVASPFGSAILVTSAIAGKSMGNVPKELLIAAAAAGAPLIVSMAAMPAYRPPLPIVGIFFIVTGSDSNHTTFLGPIMSILAVVWDLVGGYTFARVAQNHGFHVCDTSAAIIAGVVFGVLVWFMKLPLLCYFRVRRQMGRTLIVM